MCPSARSEKSFAEKAERDAARKAIMRETAGEPYNKEVRYGDPFWPGMPSIIHKPCSCFDSLKFQAGPGDAMVVCISDQVHDLTSKVIMISQQAGDVELKA